MKTTSNKTAKADKLQQLEAELALINSVQEGLADKMKMDEIYKLVGDKIRDFFDAQVIVISTFHSDMEIERIRYLYENGQHIYPEQRPVDRVRRKVIETQDILLINKNAKQVYAEITQEAPEPIPGTVFPKSLLFAPLIRSQKVMGCISLQNIDREQAFTDHDVDMLKRMTDSVTVALENALIYQAERRRADEQQALLDTMADLSQKLELNQLLNSVLERTVSLLGVTGGELAIYHEDRQELEVVSSLNLGMDSVGTILKHNEGAMGRVAATRESLIIPDYQNWEGRSDKYQKTTVRGVMGVPLIIGDKLVGALCSIHLDSNRTFDESDLRLLNMFAPLAATAIENARLFEAERQRGDEQKALLDTMSDLSRNLDLNLLLDAVVERTVSLLGVTGGELAIYHDGSKELEVVSSLHLGMQSVGTRLKHNEGVMGKVAETKEPIIIPDYQHWEGRSDKYQNTTVRAVMGVPLVIGKKLVGALCSVHLEANRTFDESDLRLLNMFAPLAATAIENARLFEAERQRADEQKALLDTMSDLSQKLDLDILLQSVIERASSLLNVTGGELAIYDDKEKNLEVVSSLNLGMQSVGTKLALGEGAMGKVAESREPIIIADYQNWEGRSDKYQKTTVHGVMGVPLLSGEKMLGAFCSVHLEPNRTFDESDLRLLNMFAPLAATAIENAQLFDTTNRLLEEAERRATELKETQEQLVQQEKLASLGQLTAGIAHEIKNPLNFVNNFSDVSIELVEEIRDEIKQLEASDIIEEVVYILDDVEANLKKILEHGQRADGIVKSMLLHSRGKSGERIPTDLNKLLDEYVKLAFHGMRAVDKAFNIDIRTDFDHSIGMMDLVAQDLSRAFLNIINNAMYAASEYARETESGEPYIEIRTRKNESGIHIHIRDNGPGIPDKIREKIFEPFFTTKPTGEGTGLGLSMTYDIIKLHNGTLQIETEPGEFSEFVITLPKN